MLEELLDRPLAPVAEETLATLSRGAIDPELALRESEIDRLLDPEPIEAECGHCFLPDGVGYVAMRVPMPEVTGAMVDWWFDWHAEDPLRYRAWHPPAHVSNSVERPDVTGAKPYWNTVHHPVEDIGLGVDHLRIEFFPPERIGFSPDALALPGVAAIVGGFAGDDRKRARHTRMVHVWLEDPSTGGTVLRSRFWIGSVLRPYLPAPIADLAAGMINRPGMRRRLVPRGAPAALAQHCAEEYTNLAAILPGLYAAYGSD